MMLAACGGSDGGAGAGGGSPVVVAPTPTPSPTPSPTAPALSVVTSLGSQSVTIGDDDRDTTVGFDAVVSGGDGSPFFANVQYNGAQLALTEEVKRDAENKYRIRFRPAADLPFGSYNGDVTFRLCADTACATVLPNTAKSFAYAMTYRLSDWTNFQRSPSHAAFVPRDYDVADFRKLWQVAPEGASGLSDVASYNGLVYVTSRNQDGTSSVRALASTSGEQQWIYSLGVVSSAGPPSVGNGKVLVASMTTSSGNNPVVSIDAKTGGYAGEPFPFASQWADFMAPTTYGSGVYMAAGYYGGVAYGFDRNQPTAKWETAVSPAGVWDLATVAADAKNVYYYAGATLGVIDRISGALLQSIKDPFYQQNFYDYYGGPIIGSRGNVMAYSGNRSSQTPSVLVNWSIADGGVAWRSGDSYVTSPALGGGSVYLARNQPGRLDALDEATGAVRWSWSPPSGERFIGNTIVTRNLVFASTDRAVYALPVAGADHSPLWSAGTGGNLAITADGVLVVAVPDSNGRIVSLAGYRIG
ncbi:PQQ-binding-like beta-propeller repeat protein [Sphingomonas sp. NPDC079357]|uniref:outer membrane protein assembly factor BamB family protein n=1 Tax=Sphingomonas sp. NPDC079357 TaxID=3364518 RepID=UPI00384D4BBA